MKENITGVGLALRNANKRTIFIEELKNDIADNIFSQVIELIKKCYMSGMPIDFLYEQIIILKDSYKSI